MYGLFQNIYIQMLKQENFYLNVMMQPIKNLIFQQLQIILMKLWDLVI
jgi:hypothetical protein